MEDAGQFQALLLDVVEHSELLLGVEPVGVAARVRVPHWEEPLDPSASAGEEAAGLVGQPRHGVLDHLAMNIGRYVDHLLERPSPGTRTWASIRRISTGWIEFTIHLRSRSGEERLSGPGGPSSPCDPARRRAPHPRPSRGRPEPTGRPAGPPAAPRALRSAVPRRSGRPPARAVRLRDCPPSPS